jgi:tetratricopeptide (TPR) repeat protein
MRGYEINDADFFASRGMEEFFCKQYLRCIDDYNKAIAIDENDSGAIFIRGLAYLELGYNDEALADFDKALGMGLDIPNHFINMYVRF